MGRYADIVLLRLLVTTRGAQARTHAFELWVGLAGFVSGVVFAYAPASLDGNALAHTIGYPLAAAYTVAYAAAGVMIWWGLLRPSPAWEVAGLILLGAGTAANGVAVLATFGMAGVATSLTLIALAAAAAARAWLVYHAYRPRAAE